MRLTHYNEHKKRWQINDDYGAVMIDELNYAVGEAIDKLAAYEDAEEQGLLIRLPCKVGDTLYEPTDRKTISEYKVKAIRVELFSVWIEWNIVSGFVYRSLYGVEASEIGKTVFLTREEAEAALKGEKKNV